MLRGRAGEEARVVRVRRDGGAGGGGGEVRGGAEGEGGTGSRLKPPSIPSFGFSIISES